VAAIPSSSASDDIHIQFSGDSVAIPTGLTTLSTPKIDVGSSKISSSIIPTNTTFIAPPFVPTLPSLPPQGTEKEPLTPTTIPAPIGSVTKSCGSTLCTVLSGPGLDPNSTRKSFTLWNITSTYTRPPTPPTTTDFRAKTPSITLPTISDEGDAPCTPFKKDTIPTTYSVVYTSTTTLYGNQSLTYSPPFPDITTPVTCATPVAGEASRGQWDFSIVCTTSKGVASCSTATLYKVSWAPAPTTESKRIGAPDTGPGTVTFLTTDKNPSVIYLPDSTPAYGQPTGDDTDVSHKSVSPDDVIRTQIAIPSTRLGGAESMKRGPTPEFKVTAGPTAVTINTVTVTPAPGQTTSVTVDGNVFVINPSQIIGAGAVIQRPVPQVPALPSSTSTNIAGIPVVITSSQAIIGGATFSIGPTPTTVTIGGQTVSIGPSGIGFAGASVTVGARPQNTEIVVAGGEMITAIGPSVVVIHSTTLTYGPGTSARTEVIDDDTIVVGPLGVVVHGTTIGGPKAGPTDTTYEIVGGATITQVGSSVVVIGGTTYTVGPGTGKTTTMIGGETVTIGPDGVTVSTLSFSYPFGPTVVTTLKPSPTATPTPPSPSETSKNAAVSSSKPRWGAIIMGLCIAIGVWVLGCAI
jgi:hypothetical protein